MPSKVKTFALAVALALGLPALAASCGGVPAASHPNLMDRTTAGQERCAMTKSHERPFVIEWDATDLASFEAKAQRDIVFVRYEGCHLSVLYGCSDESLPGKLGAYAPPLRTSGTVESVDIEDQGKLYAELPLSAATLSGRLEQGDKLHMRYFVGGVVTATRDTVARPALSSIAACAGATHFVWAYNLGAFELTTGARDQASAQVGIGGMGAGGSKSHAETRLKSGGDLTSCTGEDSATARACRVPIRLALRAIGEAPAATAASAASGATASAPGSTAPPSGREEARQVLLGAVKRAQEDSRARIEARRKAELGDGAACLEDLDRLAQKHAESHYDDELRSMCEMRAGKCDAGKSRYRQYLEREVQETGRATDIDRRVEERAATYCKGAQGSPRERAMRAKDQVVSASSKNDGAACAAAGRELMTAVGELPKTTDAERDSARSIAGYAMNAVACAAKGGRCADARAIYAQHFKLANPNASAAAQERGFTMVAKECAGR